MAMQVCHGAVLQCSFGMTSSNLVISPQNRVCTGTVPAANIMDHVSMVNIQPFGLCLSLANPAVAVATAAAMGALVPMPCIPATTGPWVPGVVDVLIGNQPAVDENCTLTCMWAGSIKVAFPGQISHMVP